MRVRSIGFHPIAALLVAASSCLSVASAAPAAALGLPPAAAPESSSSVTIGSREVTRGASADSVFALSLRSIDSLTSFNPARAVEQVDSEQHNGRYLGRVDGHLLSASSRGMAIAVSLEAAMHARECTRTARPPDLVATAASLSAFQPSISIAAVDTVRASSGRAPLPFIPLGGILISLAALAAPRDTTEREGTHYSLPVKGGVVCYQGGIAVSDGSGNVLPASAATGLIAIGRFDETIDNSVGADGAVSVKVRRGVFHYANSAAGDAITEADIGKICWLVDDQTVAKTSNGQTRSAAGRIRDVDAGGVWVEIGVTLQPGEVTPDMLSSYAPLAALVAAGLGKAAAYTKVAAGAQANLLAATGADRIVLIVVHVDEAFADGSGAQTVFKIGQTGTDNKFMAVGVLVGAAAGAVKVFAGTLTAGDALFATATAATGTGTGGITVSVLAIPAAA